MESFKEMDSKKIFADLTEVYNSLSDELSKKIFEQRVLVSISPSLKNVKNLITLCSDEAKKQFNECENHVFNMEVNDGDTLVFYGAGITGEAVYGSFKSAKNCQKFFCDRSYMNIEPIDGCPIISPDELLARYQDAKIIITTSTGSIAGKDNVKSMLLSNGVDEKNIYLSVFVDEINQYFDPLITFSNDEVFVDCGALDGNTSRIFAEKVGNKYRHIHIFEPDTQNLSFLKKKNQFKSVTYHSIGVWSEKDELSFSMNSGGSSCIIEKKSQDKINSTVQISVNSLDNIFKSFSPEDVPTFIKMDIEGSEMKALKGACNLIKKYTPKLAIAIYHKNEDILDIIAYIKRLVPEYSFYLRHYTTCVTETIMYAVNDKNQ